MNTSPLSSEDQIHLLDQLIDGTISEADQLRIEAELLVDEAVRNEYYRRLKLDYLLRQESLDYIHHGVDETTVRRKWHDRVTLLGGVLLGLAASLLIGLVLVARYGTQQVPINDSEITESTASGFAVLKGQSMARWKDRVLLDGDLIPKGELELSEGRVQLELFSGVQVVVEGNALFSIDSPMQVTLVRGGLRAVVPEPAQGFTVRTSSGDIVDLGTEFAVNVDLSGADVEVVEGEIELRSKRIQSRRADQGDRLRLGTEGDIVSTDPSELGLIGPDEFQDLLASYRRQRLERWTEKTQLLQNDPRLVAWYDFAPQGVRARTLENRSDATAPKASDGAVVAAESSTDRFGRADGALNFGRIGSRVRVNVPGKHQGLTLNCWVRISSLDRWYNSLFLTDGHEQREPHWQIMEDGRVFFSVKLPDDRMQNQGRIQPVFYSPPIWNESQSGRWTMLSVSYDIDQRLVTHFQDGKVTHRQEIPAADLVDWIEIGPASICNWSQPMYRTNPEFVLRHLNGSMDEFAIYSEALSTDEVLNLYRVGTPNER